MPLADLGVDAGDGRPGERDQRRSSTSPAARRGRGRQGVTDEGDGGAKLVEFLAAQKIV